MKTADRPHTITILVSTITTVLSLSALVVSVISLHQSRSAQLATKATSRAMLVLKSAQLSPRNGHDVIYSENPPIATEYFKLLFQVENVGKAIAHNPSLQYDLEGSHGLQDAGTIKFMDDPPGTPVVGEGKSLGIGWAPTNFRRIGDPRTLPSEVLSLNDLTLHYRLSYDDEATGAHFDEKESCGEFSVGPVAYFQAPGRPKPQLPEIHSGSFPMLPCLPRYIDSPN